MTCKHWIQDPATGKLIPAHEYQRERVNSAPMVMNDIAPYQSMVDGSIISSRSKHRAHLKQHGCIEIGNEKIKPPEIKKDPNLKRRLIEAYNQRIGV